MGIKAGGILLDSRYGTTDVLTVAQRPLSGEKRKTCARSKLLRFYLADLASWLTLASSSRPGVGTEQETQSTRRANHRAVL